LLKTYIIFCSVRLRNLILVCLCYHHDVRMDESAFSSVHERFSECDVCFLDRPVRLSHLKSSKRRKITCLCVRFFFSRFLYRLIKISNFSTSFQFFLIFFHSIALFLFFPSFFFEQNKYCRSFTSNKNLL